MVVGGDVYMVPGDTRDAAFPARVVKKARTLISFQKVDDKGKVYGNVMVADMNQPNKNPATRAEYGSGNTIYQSPGHYERHIHEKELIMRIHDATSYMNRNRDNFTFEQLIVAATALGIGTTK